MESRTASESGRETMLTRTFGEDTSLGRWIEFKNHFELVRTVNLMNNVKLWKDEKYQAMRIRLQLSGEVEQWLVVAEAENENWMKDSNSLIARLAKRYETSEGREIAIKVFEESKQTELESIEAFLTRLRKQATYAFPLENQDSVRSRVLWRWISGLNNEFIRMQILQKGWISESGKAKQYEEILQVALQGEALQKATFATTTNYVASTTEHQPNRNLEAIVEQLSEKVEGLCAIQKSRGIRQGRPVVNGQCWYCKRSHPGGYRSCRLRLRENPDWKPSGNRQFYGRKNFQ